MTGELGLENWTRELGPDRELGPGVGTRELGPGVRQLGLENWDLRVGTIELGELGPGVGTRELRELGPESWDRRKLGPESWDQRVGTRIWVQRGGTKRVGARELGPES